MKRTDRRTFLKIGGYALGGVALGGLMAPLYSCENKSGNSADNTADSTATDSADAVAMSAIAPFGIQLWTVKEAMAEDPKGTLEKLASYGYKQIESFDGEQGMWWGMSHTDFAAYIQDLGMKVVASHCNFKENAEQKAAQAAEIGLAYLVDPWEGPQEDLAAYRKLAEDFNRYGKICQDAGLGFAYHNHDYSFKEIEGEVPHKLFMEETDPELVDFEMDIYWVVTAGEDPVKWLRDYPGRWKLCHIKDRMKSAPESEAQASTQLGTGMIDYGNILKAAQDNGMEYYIVEQERFDGSSPLESSKENAEFMADFKI
ncbi:sugar phosphate isomerase/epimerase family protein [Roseivirga sp. BDSF3-8]|uniref:sugar phosphate isomerase/epimerase family protein n=1 Tax=Roseivirga sp. BDSF3-8 TaxID=3241598 RepID=UPI0035323315